jgi:DNA-binding response OmpR family regulator
VAEPIERRRLLVLADDLIWSTRLVGHVRAAGLEAVPARSAAAFAAGLVTADGAIVDLTSRAYDGLAAIAAARDAGVPVLAVGQHDDHVLRRDALAVGADRVLAYRKLFDDGPATITRWLTAAAAPAAAPDPADQPEPTETSSR